MTRRASKPISPKVRALAQATRTLQLVSPLVRRAALNSATFMSQFNLATVAELSIGPLNLSVTRSVLFDAARKVWKGARQATFKDRTGVRWTLRLSPTDRLTMLARCGDREMALPDLTAISPRRATRLAGFERSARQHGLPVLSRKAWEVVLKVRPLDGNEIARLFEDLKATPTHVSGFLALQVAREQVVGDTWVPRSAIYYERLVGTLGGSRNTRDYARGELRAFLQELLKKPSFETLQWALLLGWHSDICAELRPYFKRQSLVMPVLTWARDRGDLVSQAALLEILLPQIALFPKAVPLLAEIARQLLTEATDDSRYAFQCGAFILAEGELSQAGLFRDKPPFWRRLATLAHASLLERHLGRGVLDVKEFVGYATRTVGRDFYLRGCCDLRVESRWSADLAVPEQLRAELLGRVLFLAYAHRDTLRETPLQRLLLGKRNALSKVISHPQSMFPGPLEGIGVLPHQPPPELAREIEQWLRAEPPDARSLLMLMNTQLVFSAADLSYASLAAKALKATRRALLAGEDGIQLDHLLRGLAQVAAIARNEELAEEVLTLARHARVHSIDLLGTFGLMAIGLIAAGCHEDLTAWCEAAGKALYGAAIGCTDEDEARQLRADIEKLCGMVTELWRTAGRAEAGVRGLLGV